MRDNLLTVYTIEVTLNYSILLYILYSIVVYIQCLYVGIYGSVISMYNGHSNAYQFDSYVGKLLKALN